jgi:hypothetical protein
MKKSYVCLGTGAGAMYTASSADANKLKSMSDLNK